MPKEASTGMTKKHISTACTWCRNRKVKCDGQTPTCSNCILYGQQCHYDYSDKRRLPHKKTIQSLRDRVTFLEDLLEKHGIKIPVEPTSASDFSVANSNDNDGGKARNDGHLHENSGHQDAHMDFQTATRQPDFDNQWLVTSDIVHGQPTSDLLHSSIESQQDIYQQDCENHDIPRSGLQLEIDHFDGRAAGYSALSMSDNAEQGEQELTLDSMGHLQQSLPAPNDQIEHHSEIPPISARGGSSNHDQQSEDDDIIDQLSARTGAFQIAEDGQLRYFGATSNLHILHDGLLSFSQGASRSVREEGENVLNRAGLNRFVNPLLEKHLEDLYFKWEDPAIHVVDEDMYYLAKEAYNSGQDSSHFYSETLQSAICAAGSCLSSRTDFGTPQEAAAFFSSQAKLLLEIEMDSPLIATVQALVIMSGTEAAFKRDARGWLYSGMAVRLSADLGLNLDLRNDVQSGTLTSQEQDVRRTTFWGVFIQDNMWSLYVGRPWGISIQDISVSRPPRHLDILRSKRWSPSPSSPEANSDAEDQRLGWYDPVQTCADANVSLCVMMRQLSQTVYSGRKLSEERLVQFATNMRAEFRAWETDLPPELKVDINDENQSYLPHVLQLHMQFYAISILLHRPFFSRQVNSPKKFTPINSEDPRSICISAAQSIIKLLRIFRKQHTLRRTNVHIVHLIFTASLICVYNTCVSKGAAATSSSNDLQFCCQSLGEIGEAYQNASRALEVIICIKRDWFSKRRNLSMLKKRVSMAESEETEGAGRKRRFTQSQQDLAHVRLPPTQEVISTSDGGGFNAGNQTWQDLDSWNSQNEDFSQSISSESFFGNIFSISGDSSLLDPSSGTFANTAFGDTF